MGDQNGKPPLARRVPGATRAAPANVEAAQPPELPEPVRQRLQAVVSAAHAQAAREAEVQQNAAAKPEERTPTSRLPSRLPSAPSTPPRQPPERFSFESYENAETDTAPIPRLTASGAVAAQEFGGSGTDAAPRPSQPNGVVKHGRPARHERERTSQKEHERAAQERARQQQEAARAGQEGAGQERERAEQEARARAAGEERAQQERAAAEERAKQARAKLEQERIRLDQERAASQERTRQEQERAEKERAELQARERVVAEERARQERERAAREERKREARQDRAAQRQLAAERKRAAKAERERAAQERAEQQRAAEERGRLAERQAAEQRAREEQERARREEERAARERIRRAQELEDREWAAQRRARLEQQREEREEAEERARRERERAAGTDSPERPGQHGSPPSTTRPDRAAEPAEHKPAAVVSLPEQKRQPEHDAEPQQKAQHAQKAQPQQSEPERLRRYRAPLAVAAVLALLAGGWLAVARSVHTSSHAPAVSAAAALRNQAARWVEQQVSRSDVISCDPVMCQALTAHGVPADDLRALGPDTANPLKSQIVVATPAIRKQFGSRLTSVYAPAVIASFGSGNARIDVRVTAPQGASEYLSQLRADQQARKAGGTALIALWRFTVSVAAGRQLASGQVDSRLMLDLSSMTTSVSQLNIAAFGDLGPGATAGVPLRSATLTGSPASLRSIAAFLDGQAPYRPAQLQMTRFAGKRALRIEFAAPSPLGVLDGPNS
jgi:hypothetical protein